MKSISIRELHEKTGHWVRRAATLGEIVVTDRGATVAKIIPQEAPKEIPYFARRKMSPAFKKLYQSGKLKGGRDVTELISEDREDRYR